MWGNRTGWLMSAVIAFVMIALMGLLQWSGTTPSSMTPKFAADADNLKPIALPVAPETVVAMPDECDAASAYGEALVEYRLHPSFYSPFDAKNVDKMTALDKLVAGAKCKKLTIFTSEPSRVVSFERTKEPIEAFRVMGEACATKGSYLAAKKDFDNAKKYAEAAFALGAKMFNERVVYEELDAGLGVMGAATGALMRIANDDNQVGRVAELKAFDDARRAFADRKGRVWDLHSITKTIDGNISASRAGDVFVLAEKSQERMWRVEACLQLARTHRYVGDDGRAADQRYAQMLLRRLTNDKDPVVKFAATKALNITEDEYNKQ